MTVFVGATPIDNLFSGTAAWDANVAAHNVLFNGDGDSVNMSALELGWNLLTLGTNYGNRFERALHPGKTILDAVSSYEQGRTTLQDLRTTVAGVINRASGLYAQAMMVSGARRRFAEKPPNVFRGVRPSHPKPSTTAPFRAVADLRAWTEIPYPVQATPPGAAETPSLPDSGSPARLRQSRIRYLVTVFGRLKTLLNHPSVQALQEKDESRVFLNGTIEALSVFLEMARDRPEEVSDELVLTRTMAVSSRVADNRIEALARQAGVQIPVWVPSSATERKPPAQTAQRPPISSQDVREVAERYLKAKLRLEGLLNNFQRASDVGGITEEGKRSLLGALRDERNLNMVEILLVLASAQRLDIVLDHIYTPLHREQAVTRDGTSILVWDAENFSRRGRGLVELHINEEAIARRSGAMQKPPLLMMSADDKDMRDYFFERHRDGRIVVISGMTLRVYSTDKSGKK